VCVDLFHGYSVDGTTGGDTSFSTIQVEWMVILLMERRVVTHHSVRLVRVMAFDVEHITWGTFSSPSEGCWDTNIRVHWLCRAREL